jgi:predicted O-methyltransferase YrrM
LSRLDPDFERIADEVAGIPHTRPSKGWVLYEFVKRARSEEVIELGCAQGVGTCYLAAGIVAGSGHGHVTAYEQRTDLLPDLAALLARTGLGPYVTPRFDERGYNWMLGDLLERRCKDRASEVEFIDFCFIDGAHTWNDDGFAFFLVDKLLRPGGWILFDDLKWTGIHARSQGEREIPQVGKVVDLLVATHPDYDVIRWHNFGWARKRPTGSSRLTEMTSEALCSLLAEARASPELAQRNRAERELRA